MSSAETRGPLDMHVHLVGNGRSGSGCWIKLNLYRRMCGEVLLWAIGFKADLTDDDFDRKYAEHLVKQVRESQLSHAVILAHEEVYAPDGTKLKFGSFHTSNSWTLQAARDYPELLAAVSIHPARADALQELERCIEGGAVMLKILPPSQNIDCSLPQYREFFKKMAEAKLPLLSHTGGEYTVPVYDKKLFDPEKLRQPLECGVTVVAAHAATRSGPGWFEPDYFPAFLRMLEEYPHLYGDISALNTPNRSRGLRPCLTPEMMPRLVHGSDFPVPVSGRWAKWRGLLSKQQVKAAHESKNLLERDYRLKRAMGFDDAVFVRMWDLLRLPK